MSIGAFLFNVKCFDEKMCFEKKKIKQVNFDYRDQQHAVGGINSGASEGRYQGSYTSQ